jgi:D-alanyl-lipoteichoic acid acyltransferase DltB (MBOAT superfamily)
MQITTAPYFAFLIVVFFAYWSVAEKPNWRIAFVAIASYFFYWHAGPLACLLLFAVSTIDFTTSRLMVRSSASLREDTFRRFVVPAPFGRVPSGGLSPPRRFTNPNRHTKVLLAISLVADIGALCIFKYANFFLDSAGSILSAAGAAAPAIHLKLLAPIGMSFFIFQSMAYVIDVYREDTEPAQTYLEYLSFVSFFPTIVAGPILRAKQLLPQLRSRISLDAEAGGQALFLIAIGLLKKIAIADYLGANLVDRVFDFPERFSSLEVLAAVYGYAIQIYADFSGYSDIAIGSALLLGLTLPTNFNAPYRSRNLAEFWRRWHISLSTWLRDYVFFSIAGKRVRNRTMLYSGLILTMLIGGLWHGASWTFVIWGALHGAGLVVVRYVETARPMRFLLPGSGSLNRDRRLDIVLRCAAIFVTFQFICLTWIFFRAESITQALAVVRQISTLTFEAANLTLPVAIVIAIGFISHWTPDRAWDLARGAFIRLPAPAQAALLFGLALGLYLVASSDVAPFIYTRF